MADSSNSTGALGANTRDEVIHRASIAAFDPADWLARFRDLGGWWLLDADNKLLFGVPEEDEPLALYANLRANNAHREAVRNHLRAVYGEVNHA